MRARRAGGYMGDPAWQALIKDIAPSKDRGKVMGLMGTFAGIIALPASYLGGYLYIINPNFLLLSESILEAMQIPLILLFFRDVKKKNN